MVRVVTISASFGAGGALVGPSVAEALGLPFIDRAIPVAVAQTLAVPLTEALEHDERRPSALKRIIASFAGASAPLGPTPTIEAATAASEDEFRVATERVIREVSEGAGGVILGRAAAVVLADFADALHVRLKAPRDARVERVMSHQGVDRAEATKRVDETDKAWESYVKFFYKADPRDPRLYHVILDTVALPVRACTDLIAAAARARQPAGSGGP